VIITKHIIEYKFELNKFDLTYGGSASNIKIKYSIYGKLSLPIVVVLGGISANHKVMGQEGWWNDIVGEGKAIDISKFCVISIDYYAGVPSPRLKNTLISSYDQASIVKRLLDYLNIKSIHAFVGSSYGGMVALAFAELYANYSKHLICICAAHKNSIKSIALREVQRNIVKLTSLSKEGVALARSLAMIGYRGEEEFEERFSTEPKISNGRTHFEVSHYLEHNGRKFANNFDTNKYLNLSNSIDIHRINPKSIKSDTLLIAINSDQLVPIKLVKELQKSIPASCQFQEIPSKFGHDGFLLEHEKIGNLIQQFLKKEKNNDSRI